MKRNTNRRSRALALFYRSARRLWSDKETGRRLLVMALSTGLFFLCMVLKPGGPKVADQAVSVADIALGLLGAWWCFAAALSRGAGGGGPAGGGRPEPARRVTLSLLGLGLIAAVLGDAIWSYNLTVLRRPMPFPSWADASYLSQYPLFLLGILRLPTRRLPPALRWRVVLDSLVTLAALVTLFWYFVLGPTVLRGTGSLFDKCLAAAFPLGDLMLLVSLLLVMAQRRDSVPRPAVAALCVGLTCIITADTAFLCQMLEGTYTDGGVVGVFGPLAYLSIGLGAGLSRRRTGAGASDERPAVPLLWRSLLPYALVPAVGALLAYTRTHRGDGSLEAGVWVGAALLVALVVARQAVAIQRLIADLRERIAELEDARHHLTALAERDGLTGLFNHRVFHRCFGEEAERARAGGGPLTVALVDLNNFKFFNDAYGHLAGDDVLRQVALALRACCGPGDTLARFGGDEFALLLPGVGAGEADGLAARLQAGLDGLAYRPPGGDVEIPLRLSVGAATLPGDGPGRLDALALADARLYRAKTGGGADDEAQRVRAAMTRSVEGFSMLDALVTAVDNKDRYTRQHSEDVLAYGLQIAERLGLDGGARQTIAVAALLHDVGKIGVPDQILRKPGRLTDEEVGAVRHHPTMGAILVGAVPGFEDILDAVRHHHERWDGDGYPFGLRGEETPLLARLLAVADAFSAMTTDRPYRKGMSEARALAILEGGAGTQWDPDLAHLFVAARRASAPQAPAQGIPLKLAA